MAWASSLIPGADDWVVVAQQSDEAARDFTQRVCRRARRLRREDAQIDSVDVYAGPRRDRLSSAARREVIEQLGVQLAIGGQLNLWSASDDPRGDRELSAILAQLAPILAERQIATNHQACEPDERSGVRHVRPAGVAKPEFEFENASGDFESPIPG